MNNKKRMEKDVMKLILSEYQVLLKDEDKMNEFSVIFKGPPDSPYEKGSWQVDVLLPDQYPYKSPSIGFTNKIYHPNIDEASGSVCLDVINQTWSPMYELKNIFDVFLPQLLMYPNPSDPLNGQAAVLYTNDKDKYDETVKEHVLKHAIKDISNKNESSNVNNLQSDKGRKIIKVSKKKDEEDDDLSELSAASFDKENLSEID